MEIDHQGEVVEYELNEGVIRSAERMTYTAVNAVLEGDRSCARATHRWSRFRADAGPGADPEPQARAAGLHRLRPARAGDRIRRERNDEIDHALGTQYRQPPDRGIHAGRQRERRAILGEPAVASLYRIHEKPDAKRVYDFETIAATFGYSLGVGALPIQRVQMKTDRRAARGTGRNARQIEVPKEVHITPRMYQKLTEKIAGKPEEQILSYLMLRSLKQARYSEVNEGHFALAAPTYTHFTSPIRRYPDLIVHRILKEVLQSSPERWDGEVPVGVFGVVSGGVRPAEARQAAHSDDRNREQNLRAVSDRPADADTKRESHDFGRAEKHPKTKAASAAEPSRTSARHDSGSSPWSKRRDHASQQKSLEPAGGPIPLDELHDIAEESSQSERRADDAERELMEWKKVKFMQGRIGEVFEGLIISVTKYGLFVELKDLFVEGLIPLNTLTDDHYTYHEATREIIGQRTRKTYHLGQPVEVLVDRIDPVEKKIQFALYEEVQPVKKRAKRR